MLVSGRQRFASETLSFMIAAPPHKELFVRFDTVNGKDPAPVFSTHIFIFFNDI